MQERQAALLALGEAGCMCSPGAGHLCPQGEQEVLGGCFS